MGNEILHDWAENKESVKVKEARNDRGKLTGNSKKCHRYIKNRPCQFNY